MIGLACAGESLNVALIGTCLGDDSVVGCFVILIGDWLQSDMTIFRFYLMSADPS
jgi:hypothetical protein